MTVDYTDALEQNWRIFPLYPIKNGKCTCEKDECNAAGKHPKASNWQHTQPMDDTQLAYLEDFDGIFFGNQLLDHYGIVVDTSGLLVVDVDGRNGGLESAKKLSHVREKAGFIVKTGSGAGEHWYFRYSGDASLRQSLPEYSGIDFKSTGFVVGAGSLHVSGMRYEAIKGGPSDITDAPIELIELLERPERDQFMVEGHSVSFDELQNMLKHIKHDTQQSYDRWLAVGMGLHHATGGAPEGEELWEQWTRDQGRDDVDSISQKWHSFGKSAEPITQGTLMTWAREGGYSHPVTFEDDTEWGEVESAKPTLANTDYISVLPKGSLVQALYEWINANCLFPREKIAFGAAVQAVSNIAGLNYRVKRHDTTLNLITFAIADSGTGKEAVYQSLLDIMTAAGVARAAHGSIKSEQELVRNLIRNQASLYVIDEYGTDLAKIAHAKKGSSANYLVAVPETIMKIFTKANASYPVTGDMAEEQRERLERQKAALVKRADSGANVDEQLKYVERRLVALNTGIPEPYLTFFGITEPTSFDAAIESNLHLITNGFIGRALIFREHIGVPDIRPDFNGKKPLPWALEDRLRNIYAQGNSIEPGDEVERKLGAPALIPLTDEAEKELNIIYQFWRQEALALEAEGQGLHTIPMRAREMVIKLAAIFSIPEEEREIVIDVEHIRAAQKITADLIKYKVEHCKTVIGSQSNDSAEKGSALLTGIMSVLQSFGADGVTIGIIRNRLRSFTREQVDAGVEHLVSNGSIAEHRYRDSRNREQIRYIAK